MTMSKKSGIGKLFAGLAVGAGLGMLFSPKTGSENRKDLKNKMDELLVKLKDIDATEVKINVENKVNEIKADLKDLNKEKALKIAKTKSKDIQKKADELVAYAKEKGGPVLEDVANSVRDKAIDVTKDVLKKLQNK